MNKIEKKEIITVYNYLSYKQFYNDWVLNQPNGGHGEYRRLAIAMDVSTTMISQVFKADKHLSLEIAAEMAEYLSLDDDESEYFLMLVEYERAGSYKLQSRLRKQLSLKQAAAKKLENRVKSNNELGEQEKVIFYSSWIYSGVRMLTDIERFNNANDIAEYLNIPKNQVQKVLEFLIANRLVVQEKNRLKMGPARTHVGSSSSLVSRIHQNWRIQGMNRLSLSDEDNFFYTGPMVLSQDIAEKIRLELPAFVERLNAEVLPSKSETVRCLNIDWFKY